MPVIQCLVFVNACEKCNLVCSRRVWNVRTGKSTVTDKCICGGKLVRKPMNEWLNGPPHLQEPVAVG